MERQSTTRPPFFDGSNYIYWKTRMRISLTSCVFDLWQVALDGHMDPKANIGSWDDKTKKAHYEWQSYECIFVPCVRLNI